jgi:hypothetical protein
MKRNEKTFDPLALTGRGNTARLGARVHARGLLPDEGGMDGQAPRCELAAYSNERDWNNQSEKILSLG